jgi:hypothetical protein
MSDAPPGLKKGNEGHGRFRSTGLRTVARNQSRPAGAACGMTKTARTAEKARRDEYCVRGTLLAAGDNMSSGPLPSLPGDTDVNS